MSLETDAEQLEAALSALTAALPELPIDDLLAHAATATTIADRTGGATADLARSLARGLACYADGQVPLEGWGLVVSSAHTLTRAIAEPTGGHAGAALIAARFELDSLLPGPASASPAPRLVTPAPSADALDARPRGAGPAQQSWDVSLSSLRRRT